jgi:hypothetical protein
VYCRFQLFNIWRVCGISSRPAVPGLGRVVLTSCQIVHLFRSSGKFHRCRMALLSLSWGGGGNLILGTEENEKASPLRIHATLCYLQVSVKNFHSYALFMYLFSLANIFSLHTVAINNLMLTSDPY